MKNCKKFISLFLSIVMLAGIIGILPVNSNAYEGAEGENAVNEVSLKNAAENELLVSFSASTSDKKIEKIIEGEDTELETIITSGSEKLAVVSTDDEIESAEALFENGAVKSVQPNYKYEFKDNTDDPYMSKETYAKYQYQFENTNAIDAWNILESGTHSSVIAAVVDTGVDAGHEDLKDNLILKNGQYTQYNYGEEQTAEDDPDLESGHGTHVSGIIGARYGNGIGGSGIASGHNNDLVKVLTVSASTDGEYLYTADIVGAIQYATSHGAKVVNMSFSSYVRDRLMENAIKSAYYNKNVVFVAASGNEESNAYSSPSDMKEVISVNASNAWNEPSYWSNYGSSKDITAPGNEITSTLPGDRYGTLSGTSMASPVVAGIAALVLDANPNLTPAQVYNILCASANQVEGLESPFNIYTGYGIIDAKSAVLAAKSAKSTVAVDELFTKVDTLSVLENDDTSMEVLVKPATSLAKVTYSSDNPSIARVNSNTGIIEGISAGKTIVRATAGGKSVSVNVEVKPQIKATDIEVYGLPENNEMSQDDYALLTVNFVPEQADNQEVYFESSDESVLFASDAGELIPGKVGTAVITISNYDRSITKSYSITVKKPASEVKFNLATALLEYMQIGDTFTARATAYDSEGRTSVYKGDIKYSSSNKKVFTVNEKTGVITPVAAGKAYLVAENEASGEYVAKQIIIAKKNYSGNDYALTQSAKSKNSISLKWKANPIAVNYSVQRRSATGSWSTIATVNTNTYKNTSLGAGSFYYYRVIANYYKLNGTKASFSPSNTIGAKTSADYRLKQSVKAKTAVTISWSKQTSASAYQIQYKASKSASWKTIKNVNAKTRSYKHTARKANAAGYYRIRAAYKTASGATAYFEYSPALVAKTTK